MQEFKTVTENAIGMWIYQYLCFAGESNEILWEEEVIKVIFKGLVYFIVYGTSVLLNENAEVI